MAEAAGLALAVLPLLISAAEHYEDCLRPLRRFLHFASEVDRFQRKLQIQKTIFRNQCRILLEGVVDHDVAVRMLLDGEHPCWRDPDVEECISNQLEASKDACLSIIDDIRFVLENLENWSLNLSETIQEDGKSQKLGTKPWRAIVKTKLWLSLKQAKLEDSLSELKALNDDFVRLSSQTSKLQKQQSGYTQDQKYTSKDIARVKAIQNASRRVYDALSKSCSKHAEHRTHFCLEAKTEGAANTHFRVGFARLAIQGTPAASEPVFFTIESIVQEVSNTRKRSLETELGTRKKTIKSVKFKDTQSCPTPCAPIPNYNLQTLRNLCSNQNFCDQLRTCLKDSKGDCYVGTLDDSDFRYRHLVYFPKRSATSRPALSLQEIISITARKGPIAMLSHFEKLHIARSLATAVLQYHATPWLKSPLRCEDVLFFDARKRLEIEVAPAKLSEPHINVAVRRMDSMTPKPTDASSNHCAPNPVLYHLAVIMIELAFTSSLNGLLTQKELATRDRYTDFFAAKRLAGAVSRQMGSQYSRIVEKCLGCHFSNGHNMDDTSLQAEYYRDVVKGLEKLEEEFVSLKLD